MVFCSARIRDGSSFELQRQLNPRIKKPVGHIALSFKLEDKPRLTDEFMAKIAIEYMQMMGITDTQFIIVRHHNTDNPHCHVVYNRINNEGKLISDRNDYRRNEQVTKALKSRYGLTYGTDKSKTNTRKLRNAERAKYEIYNAVKSALRMADSWDEFKSELAKRGVLLEFVYKDKERTKFLVDAVKQMRQENDVSSKALQDKLEVMNNSPQKKIVTHRFEPTSKNVLLFIGGLALSLVLSIWGNLTQWREHQDWEEADLKYRALKMVLPSDDPNVRYIEKNFSVCPNKEVIENVRTRVNIYEDSIRYHNEMIQMAAIKDSMANSLFKEANEIKKKINKK